MSAKIIAITNEKGGVGKTTTAVNLAGALGQAGSRVLLIDSDSQYNATTYVGLQKADTSLVDVYLNDIGIEDAIYDRGDFDCITSARKLASVEKLLDSEPGREMFLKQYVQEISGAYDFIIIDAPPGLGFLTISILVAATHAIVPMRADEFSIDALEKTKGIINQVRERLNPQLRMMGLLLIDFDARRKEDKTFLKHLIKEVGDNSVIRCKIRTDARLKKSTSTGKTIFEFAPTSKGATDYNNLAKEIGDKYVN